MTRRPGRTIEPGRHLVLESGILGDWLPTYQHNDSMCYRHSGDLLSIEGTDRPWVFTSGRSGLFVAKPREDARR